MAESIKSRYKPINPKKYQGNPNNIICRSSWERKFCQWADKKENVISLGIRTKLIYHTFHQKIIVFIDITQTF